MRAPFLRLPRPVRGRTASPTAPTGAALAAGVVQSPPAAQERVRATASARAARERTGSGGSLGGRPLHARREWAERAQIDRGRPGFDGARPGGGAGREEAATRPLRRRQRGRQPPSPLLPPLLPSPLPSLSPPLLSLLSPPPPLPPPPPPLLLLLLLLLLLERDGHY